jgi:hypothetical protein
VTNTFTKCPVCGRLTAGEYCTHPDKDKETSA